MEDKEGPNCRLNQTAVVSKDDSPCHSGVTTSNFNATFDQPITVLYSYTEQNWLFPVMVLIGIAPQSNSPPDTVPRAGSVQHALGAWSQKPKPYSVSKTNLQLIMLLPWEKQNGNYGPNAILQSIFNLSMIN